MLNQQSQQIELTYAHTPDADDAFMLYGLTSGKVTLPNILIKEIIKPIQALNVDAMQGLHDISALSVGAYPHVCETYAILPCGVCMGVNYGPMVVSNQPISKEELRKTKIAVPGTLTTAYLMLRLFDPELEAVEMKFDEIPQAVKSGTVGAGLVIHEVQLTYKQWGFAKVVDLGEWWHEKTGLPLPLGANVIRRSLGTKIIENVAELLRLVLRYCLDHREEALSFAMQYARGIKSEEAAKFIGMYVNESSLDYGDRGREALERMFGLAYENGILDNEVILDFAAVC